MKTRIVTFLQSLGRTCMLVGSLLVKISPVLAVTPIELVQQAYLKATNIQISQGFGYALAMSGDTVVVGTPQYGTNEEGAAFVFVRTGTSWNLQAFLRASNPDSFARFGWSVAISGNTIVIGSPSESSDARGVNGNQGNAPSGSGSGAAYVFVRNGTTWSQQAYLKSANSDAGDSFGWSVGVSGQTIIVGADQEDSLAIGVNGDANDNSAGLSGAAYVFVRVGTNWTQQAYLKASNTDGGDRFGSTVAASGEFVVVGAPVEASNFTQIQNTPLLTPEQTNNTAIRSGAAYIFGRSGTNWTQRAYLKASNAQASDAFGSSVAIDGNTVVVGAPLEDSASGINGDGSDNGTANSGAAYVFVRSGSPAIWSQQAYLKASNRGVEDLFGSAVALSGDAVVVGASREDSNSRGVNPPLGGGNNSAPSAGAAYVFVRTNTPPVWRELAYLKASNSDRSDFFGFSVGISEDVVAVGAYAEDGTALESGAVYLFSEPTPVVPGYVSTPAPGSVIDFGVRDPNYTAYRNIYVGNEGTNALEILSVELDAAASGVRVYRGSEYEPPNFPWIIPTGSTNEFWFSIAWNPTTEQVLNAGMVILTSDPRTPRISHGLVGKAYDPLGKTLEAVTLRMIANFGLNGQQQAIPSRSALKISAATKPQTTTLTLDADATHILNTEIPAHLGGGSVQLSNFTGSVTVSILPMPNDTNRMFIRIENGSFYCPSFHLPFGLETGPNTLEFGSPEQSEGILSLIDGSYTASTTATIVNNLIPDGVTVRGNYSGIYNAQTGTVGVQSQSTDLFTESGRVLFSYSTNRLWLTWASPNALEEATTVLGPWQAVTNAASPYLVVTTNYAQQFFRLRNSAP